MTGCHVLMGPYEPVPGFRVAIIEDGGCPIELIETILLDEELWESPRRTIVSTSPELDEPASVHKTAIEAVRGFAGLKGSALSEESCQEYPNLLERENTKAVLNCNEGELIVCRKY